jgi:esterase/lipase
MKICFQNIGIIIIHGLDGAINNVNLLSQKLTLLGYKVEAPHLKGYKEDKTSLKRVTYIDWIKDIEKAYLTMKDHCQEIIMIGFSSGGLLSLQVASKYKVKGIIALDLSLSRIKYLFKRVYIKLLKATKKILPLINCDVFINQSKSVNYLSNNIPCKIKKQLFFTESKIADEEMIDLIKYIESY